MAETQLISVISNGGAFALAVFLVVYVMRENSKREDRQTAMLDKYAERLEELCARIGEMAQTLEMMERRMPPEMGRK